MAKNKMQKKKDRERRVAQKKLADNEKRAQEQTNRATLDAAPKPKNVMTSGVAIPKTGYVANNAKASFTRRRSVGG